MQKINILDDFYTQEDFKEYLTYFNFMEFKPSKQPSQVFTETRLHSYPVWETPFFTQEFNGYKIFADTFEKKFNVKILKLETYLRKIYIKELEVSPFKDKKEGKIHTDGSGYDFAGVIYFNNHSIEGGTRLYSFNKNLDQMEPDIIIGAYPNRCIVYPDNIHHSPSIDWRSESRFIQVFFVQFEKNDRP